MTETKFTPGPWKASIIWDYDNDVKYLRYAGVEGPKGPSGTWDWVCIEPDCDDPDVEKQIITDTHLIAAAPDLYHALKNLIDKLVIDDEEGLIEYAEPMIEARAALVKATGGY